MPFEKAAGLYIPFADTVPGHPEMAGGYHPEHSNFNGAAVKQADTVMLSFPLGMDMPPDVLANDLAYYTLVTSQSGPAMTWAIFAIGWMEVALQVRLKRGRPLGVAAVDATCCAGRTSWRCSLEQGRACLGCPC